MRLKATTRKGSERLDRVTHRTDGFENPTKTGRLLVRFIFGEANVPAEGPALLRWDSARAKWTELRLTHEERKLVAVLAANGAPMRARDVSQQAFLRLPLESSQRRALQTAKDLLETTLSKHGLGAHFRPYREGEVAPERRDRKGWLSLRDLLVDAHQVLEASSSDRDAVTARVDLPKGGWRVARSAAGREFEQRVEAAMKALFPGSEADRSIETAEVFRRHQGGTQWLLEKLEGAARQGPGQIRMASFFAHQDPRAIANTSSGLLVREQMFELLAAGWNLRRVATVPSRARWEEECAAIAVAESRCDSPRYELKIVMGPLPPALTVCVIDDLAAQFAVEDPQKYTALHGIALTGRDGVRFLQRYFETVWQSPLAIHVRSQTGFIEEGVAAIERYLNSETADARSPLTGASFPPSVMPG